MKALSVKQPWASLIAHGIKDIENRTWKTNFRGKIYIHSTVKGANVDFTTEQTASLFTNEIWNPETGFNKDLFVFSAIIGEVEITDCVVNHKSIWAEKTKGRYVGDGVFVLNEKPIYNWVLDNPVLYEKPILNVKGKLSFWEPDVCIQKCECCETPTDIETMKSDSDSNWFCSECWKGLLPI